MSCLKWSSLKEILPMFLSWFQDKYPGIFTKVSYFLEWIKRTIDLNTKTKKRVKGKPLEKDESRGDAASDVDQGDYEYEDEVRWSTEDSWWF